ncbi:coiled-coil domain-containing protein 82 [Grus japonensis]|uniref:Coiled-coil domain-containing protein 82 n=1 Tax=Grus japonensis TaxID=30415 RepID=A0ABC9W5Y2_GRUJA
MNFESFSLTTPQISHTLSEDLGLPKNLVTSILVNTFSSITELDGVKDEPVKDTVERLLSQLEDSGWIQKRYNDLEAYMNDADSFQEEKMD